nr:preprotein translocase subunit SecA [Patescibacteria group bacterium]
KERVPIQRESVTLATITFQNYFRLYEKISGMTGTAATEGEEFHKIYKLDVLTIPTHRENKRTDLPDRVYTTELGKFNAIAREIKRRHDLGQPVLVGTASIEKNEILHVLLQQAGIPHEVLNAKNHEREAEIIAQAGRKGGVTVATNMAGRGVDILLGGNPPDKAMTEEVRALGGLCVLGSERHESRRIDNQLRGRAGRQGDPGSTQFFISVEDDLMRIFASDRMRQFMQSGMPQDEAIENRLLGRAIESAQRKVEGHHFDIRKHLLEYDDVLNKHRQVFYKKRFEFLQAAEQPTQDGLRATKRQIREFYQSDVERLVGVHASAEDAHAWDWTQIEEGLKSVLPSNADFTTLRQYASTAAEETDIVALRTKLVDEAMRLVDQAYADLEAALIDPALIQDLEKTVVLRLMDDLWILHLEAMDHLRHGIGLQGYGQRDPLVEYKKEGYRLFHELLGNIEERVTKTLFHVQVAPTAPETHETTA